MCVTVSICFTFTSFCSVVVMFLAVASPELPQQHRLEYSCMPFRLPHLAIVHSELQPCALIFPGFHSGVQSAATYQNKIARYSASSTPVHFVTVFMSCNP